MEKSIYQKIQEWHELLKEGIITEAEFSQKKKDILDVSSLQSQNEIKLSSVNRAVQLDINEPPISAEEKERREEEYNTLFNKKNWVQKNKNWIIGLLIVLVTGTAIWYLIETQNKAEKKNSTALVEKETTLTNFIKIEQERDYSVIKTFFADPVERYWDLSYPSNFQIEKRYQHFWDITVSSPIIRP